MARGLGEDLVGEVHSALGRRIKSEVQKIFELPADSRRTRSIRRLRDAADQAGSDLHTALRTGGAPPPLESLSPGARRASQ